VFVKQKAQKTLVVMIPCLNEEKTLPLVVKSIPKRIKGISKVKILVIDDGSTDKTLEVAKKLKVDYVIQHLQTQGLAKSFSDGLDYCLKKDAYIIVNTDGDNQYPQQDISRLIKPILDGKARIVIANRQTDKIKHFSPTKKILQKLGSWVVRYISGVDVPDAVSGFRAYSRAAAMQLNVITEFSYCTETIIQAGKKKIAVASINVKTNPKTRESRLFKNDFQHIKNTAATIFRIITMYEPLKVFTTVGFFFMAPGILIWIRFAYYYFYFGNAQGHLQSLFLATIFIVVGFQICIFGLIADSVAANRRLVEKTLFILKNRSLKQNV
jgi:glycosyltransferase involved in cell wall biosynthesis